MGALADLIERAKQRGEDPTIAEAYKAAALDMAKRRPVKQCAGCTAPVADKHRRFCNYCSNRVTADLVPLVDEVMERNVQARVRLDAWARSERPRVTAEARELAKPHPWSCDE